jgi:hypothetical protein
MKLAELFRTVPTRNLKKLLTLAMRRELIENKMAALVSDHQAAKLVPVPDTGGRRRLSAAVRAKMAQAARRRWRVQKANGKNRL